MRQSIKTSIVIAWVAISVSGCMVIWTDQVFVATAFKTVDAKDLGLVADPNSTRIGSGETKTENDKIEGTAVIGGIPVKIGSGE